MGPPAPLPAVLETKERSKKENICFLSFSFLSLSFLFFPLSFSFSFLSFSGRQAQAVQGSPVPVPVDDVIAFLSSPVPLCQDYCVQKSGRRGGRQGGHISLCQEWCIQKSRKGRRRNGQGMYIMTVYMGLWTWVLLFRKMLIFVQECCHKNFYISRNARYNQGKQGQVC